MFRKSWRFAMQHEPSLINLSGRLWQVMGIVEPAHNHPLAINHNAEIAPLFEPKNENASAPVARERAAPITPPCTKTATV